MLTVAVGHSHDPDSQTAISEVLAQIDATLAGVTPKAGILFAALDFDHGLVLQQIDDVFPGIHLIGGTTDGEISSVLGFGQDSLTLIVFGSEQIMITAGLGQGASKDVTWASQTAVQQAQVGHETAIQFCLSLPESLTTSGAQILDGLTQALGAQIPIFGGLTAAHQRSQKSYQFFKTAVCRDAIPILLFSGPILFSHGIASGWQPIGKPGRITKADKNVVYEIDDQPAMAFYHRYLGALPPSSEYPLALFNAGSDRYYMRAPNGSYDPAVGSITFFGDVPEQAVVQITETTHDQILSASATAMQQALATYPGEAPAAALFFSCAGRRRILGRRACEEYEIAQRSLAQALPSCGFYSNGEIAPLEPQGANHFHNETFITLLLGDA